MRVESHYRILARQIVSHKQELQAVQARIRQRLVELVGIAELMNRDTEATPVTEPSGGLP